MNGDTPEASTDAEGNPQRRQRTAAEWAVFAVAALVIVLVAGVLVVGWAAGSSDPPRFRTQMKTVRALEGGYQVPVEVQNVGDQAAANVKVSAELQAGAKTRKTEETIDFLAPAEKTMVTFVFDRDPTKGHLSVSVSAFREP